MSNTSVTTHDQLTKQFASRYVKFRHRIDHTSSIHILKLACKEKCLCTNVRQQKNTFCPLKKLLFERVLILNLNHYLNKGRRSPTNLYLIGAVISNLSGLSENCSEMGDDLKSYHTKNSMFGDNNITKMY